MATHEYFFFEKFLLNCDSSVKSGQIFSWTYSKHVVQLCSYYRRYTVEWLLRAWLYLKSFSTTPLKTLHYKCTVLSKQLIKRSLSLYINLTPPIAKFFSCEKEKHSPNVFDQEYLMGPLD